MQPKCVQIAEKALISDWGAGVRINITGFEPNFMILPESGFKSSVAPALTTAGMASATFGGIRYLYTGYKMLNTHKPIVEPNRMLRTLLLSGLFSLE
jgi:hypothetical protein